VASSMISSLAESITNWANDRSIALGGPTDVGAVVQIRPAESFPSTMVTDARGLPRAIAASRAMRSKEYPEQARSGPPADSLAHKLHMPEFRCHAYGGRSPSAGDRAVTGAC
jgi:hypothetical protein